MALILLFHIMTPCHHIFEKRAPAPEISGAGFLLYPLRVRLARIKVDFEMPVISVTCL